MMKKRRIRRPGGGRKPQGEFSQLTSSLTVRIPDDMRKQLELESVAKDQSVGQRLLWHLRQSFNRELARDRDPALDGLLFFIAEIAEAVSMGDLIEDDRMRSRLIQRWRTDPFLFRAFKFAVAEFLERLQVPKGRPVPPVLYDIERKGTLHSPIKELLGAVRSPQGLGKFVFDTLWTQSLREPSHSRDTARSHLAPFVVEALEREGRLLPRARKALQLKTRAEEKAEQKRAIKKLGEIGYKIQLVKRLEANEALSKLSRDLSPNNRRR